MGITKRFGLLSFLLLTFLIVAVFIRAFLLVSIPSTSGMSAILVIKSFVAGAIFDLAAFSYFIIPAGLYLICAPKWWVTKRYHGWFILLTFFIFVSVLFLDSLAEYIFFDEFSSRFNFIAVDYLVYTHEVVGNIKESYHVNSFLYLIFTLSILVCVIFRKLIIKASEKTFSSPARRRSGFAILVIPFITFYAINLSLSDISSNVYACEIAQNGIYSLFAAFRNNSLDFDRFYNRQDSKEVMSNLRSLIAEKNSRYVSSNGLTRMIKADGKEKHMNIILIVEESLSASDLGCFGDGRGLSPNLDRISEKSLFFTHLYATGTRTVRGLEAMSLSTPPLPGISIVKRPDNRGFRSWGQIMKEKNYDTKYIYAGFGYFDNMNDFFMNNGYTIVDRNDFTKNEITFATIWGGCDEDLFDKVIKESDKSYKAGKPFFSTVMTTSNHKPFEFPSGRIDIPSKTGGRPGGIKYADYSIGRFIEKASREPWFSNTLFVITADHCASSAGKTELPVKKYEIPLMIYSPGNITPRHINTMMSQIDIPPTVMGILHASYTSDFFGRDTLASANRPERAFISTYQKLGYIENGYLGVLSPQRKKTFYKVDLNTGATLPISESHDLLNDMEAFYQGSDFIYKNKLSRIDTKI